VTDLLAHLLLRQYQLLPVMQAYSVIFLLVLVALIGLVAPVSGKSYLLDPNTVEAPSRSDPASRLRARRRKLNYGDGDDDDDSGDDDDDDDDDDDASASERNCSGPSKGGLQLIPTISLVVLN